MQPRKLREQLTSDGTLVRYWDGPEVTVLQGQEPARDPGCKACGFRVCGCGKREVPRIVQQLASCDFVVGELPAGNDHYALYKRYHSNGKDYDLLLREAAVVFKREYQKTMEGHFVVMQPEPVKVVISGLGQTRRLQDEPCDSPKPEAASKAPYALNSAYWAKAILDREPDGSVAVTSSAPNSVPILRDGTKYTSRGEVTLNWWKAYQERGYLYEVTQPARGTSAWARVMLRSMPDGVLVARRPVWHTDKSVIARGGAVVARGRDVFYKHGDLPCSHIHDDTQTFNDWTVSLAPGSGVKVTVHKP